MNGLDQLDPWQLVRSARTLLFVPGDRPERFDKAAASPADAVIIDLEDSVSEASKETALASTVQWLTSNPALVRVEAAGSERHRHQVQSLAALPGLLGWVVPKAEHATDLELVAASSRCPVLPLVESARGFLEVTRIAAAPGVARLTLGNLDLAADLGLPEPADHAMAPFRTALVVASAAADLAGPIDGVHAEFADLDGLTRSTGSATALGMTGKLCIHPSQILPVHDRLRPTSLMVSWARQVMSTSAAAVSTVNGQMIDRPQVLRAREILRRNEMGSTGA